MARSVKGGPYTPTRGRHKGETYPSYRQYRNALERDRGGTTLYAHQRTERPVRSRPAYERLTPQQRQAQGRAARALATMQREGVTLAEAARRAGTTPNTVRRYGGDAIEVRGGRAVVKDRYRLYRTMRMPTDSGTVTVGVTDSATARRIGRYWSAVHHYFKTGDDSRLREFAGKSVRWEKRAYPFITDTVVLDRLARTGLLDFDSIYPEAA